MPSSRLISSKGMFYACLLTITATSVIVFLTGLDIRRSIYDNTIITLSILSFFFFFTITLGLFLGLKLKNTWDMQTGKINFFVNKNTSTTSDSFIENIDVDLLDIEEGIAGIVLAILLWIAVFVLTVIISIFFEAFLLAFIAIFAGMLYWIFYRAVRLVLKNSSRCKGDLLKSMGLGLFYTILYIGWIYAIVYMIHIF